MSDRSSLMSLERSCNLEELGQDIDCAIVPSYVNIIQSRADAVDLPFLSSVSLGLLQVDDAAVLIL
jgi:hypothetical protein